MTTIAYTDTINREQAAIIIGCIFRRSLKQMDNESTAGERSTLAIAYASDVVDRMARGSFSPDMAIRKIDDQAAVLGRMNYPGCESIPATVRALDAAVLILRETV